MISDLLRRNPARQDIPAPATKRHPPETAFPHHHPRFDIDEKALVTGVITLAQAAVALAE